MTVAISDVMDIWPLLIAIFSWIVDQEREDAPLATQNAPTNANPNPTHMSAVPMNLRGPLVSCASGRALAGAQSETW